MWATMLAALLAEGPTLLTDVENVFDSIAHGPGGAAKIAKATASLAILNKHVAAAAAVANKS